MKKLITSYLNFSKKELNGILVLFFIISLIIAFPYCYKFFYTSETYDLDAFKSDIVRFKASAIQKNRNYQDTKKRIQKNEIKPEYFKFDPNSLSVSGWARLGMSPRQINVIKNYLAKRGAFHKNTDLKKIYSITEAQYLRLEPYIYIESGSKNNIDQRGLRFTKNLAKRKEQVLIEINSADSTMLDQLHGIGPAFASRIIRFRKRLGGFYSKEQLKEVYGMDSIRYAQIERQILLDTSLIEKVNVNIATFDQLKHHAYLTYKQINAILQYRRQHGNYSSADDLRKVLILDEKIIRKIEPYLSF